MGIEDEMHLPYLHKNVHDNLPSKKKNYARRCKTSFELVKESMKKAETTQLTLWIYSALCREKLSYFGKHI